jgi:hypothetical protein
MKKQQYEPAGVDPKTGEVIMRPKWAHGFPYKAKPKPALPQEKPKLQLINRAPARRMNGAEHERLTQILSQCTEANVSLETAQSLVKEAMPHGFSSKAIAKKIKDHYENQSWFSDWEPIEGPRAQQERGFSLLPHYVSRSRAYAGLSPLARDVHDYVLSKFDGRNNGKLSVTLAELHEHRGWKKWWDRFRVKAIEDLIEAGLLKPTKERVGASPACYALACKHNLRKKVRDEDS